VIYRFADPWYLLALLALPLLLIWYVRRLRRGGTLRFTRVGELLEADVRRTGRLRHTLFALRTLAVTALVVAFARPQTSVTDQRVTTEGIDIVLALDVSSSMLAEDITPNRIDAAKEVGAEFVAGRPNDRIGLVIFGGDAYTQVPLTLDHAVVTELMDQLRVGMVEDGTAVGMGLATAVKRLQGSDAVSRVVILLTDGRNNRGEIGPVTAAQMARALGVRVYTIGAGTRGQARVPVDNPVLGRQYVTVQADVDEPTLKEMAEITGGSYFRATDRESLTAIWAQIDQLERTEMEVEHFTRYGELFTWPLGVGVLLLALELLLSNTLLRKLP
jgi:Ca-activated chloride channel family protein